jgi:hypothetical protein
MKLIDLGKHRSERDGFELTGSDPLEPEDELRLALESLQLAQEWIEDVLAILVRQREEKEE